MKDRRIGVISAAAMQMEERCVDKSDEDGCKRISCRDSPHGVTILPGCSRGNFLPPKSSRRRVLLDRSLNIGYALPVMKLELSSTNIQDRKSKVRINVER